jgi:hypothetical protein
MFRVAASKVPAVRVMGRVATVSGRNITGTTRRAFHDYGNPIPEPDFTPVETILLDVTAWTVAFALIYVPNSVSVDEASEDATQEEEAQRRKEARRRRGVDRFRSEATADSEDQKEKKTSSRGRH